MKKLILSVCLLPLLACSKPDASATSAAGSASAAAIGAAKPPTSAVASAPPAAPSAAPAAAMVEMDLSSADPVWKGWVASGPAGAKVMADGVKGARIAANGMDAFDVAFGSASASLKDVKSGNAAAVKSGNLKITYLVDTADKLEWVTEVGTSKAWNFVSNYTASGKKVSCQTNTAMGASSEAMFNQLKAACATLRKK